MPKLTDKISQAIIKGGQKATELTTVKVEYSKEAEKITKTVIIILSGAIVLNALANFYRGYSKR